MKLFNLPDLGEGLPDAEIVEWHIQPGDAIKTDQLLVSMETAKAVVEVPSPFCGKIEKLFGQPGDVIKTGAPLVGFAAEQTQAKTAEPAAVGATEIVDSGTIAGELERGDELVIESARVGTRQVTHATPAIRALARHLQVDLSQLTGEGVHGTITRDQIITAAKTQTRPIAMTSAIQSDIIPDGYEPLRGVRRYMAQMMEEATEHVTHATIMDDVNIDAWPARTDITWRLLRAIVRACRAEPSMNAWYDGATRSRKIFSEVHLGLAMDLGDGLFVPVIADLDKRVETDQAGIRAQIQQFKAEVNNRTIAPEKLRGATISLSNFGNFAGRYATPIITPPQVAILGAGKIRRVPLVVHNQVKAQRIIPLSLAMDHRSVTGGEATRFLGALMDDLKKPE